MRHKQSCVSGLCAKRTVHECLVSLGESKCLKWLLSDSTKQDALWSLSKHTPQSVWDRRWNSCSREGVSAVFPKRLLTPSRGSQCEWVSIHSWEWPQDITPLICRMTITNLGGFFFFQFTTTHWSIASVSFCICEQAKTPHVSVWPENHLRIHHTKSGLSAF